MREVEVATYRNGTREEEKEEGEEKEGGRRGSRVRSTLARAVSALSRNGSDIPLVAR